MHTDGRIWSETFVKKEDIVHRSIAGETILVPVKGKLADMQRIFALNPVAAFVWNQLDGRKTLGDIRSETISHFEGGQGQADADIEEFIAQLLKEGLILRKE
ncbi:MAG: PqqD family protein [Nitrospirota bacterium]